MKIAIFSDNFYPEISGISDSVILLAKEFSDLGHEVHFFAPKYAKSDYDVANIEQKELELGAKIKIHRFWSFPLIGSPTGQSRVVIPFGFRCLKFQKEKFDIIHTQSPYGCGMEALFMSKIFGIPLFGTNHTPITEFTKYLPFKNKLFDWVGLNFVAWYYNRCKFVTAPFTGILDEMKSFGFKRDAISLSNPLDLKNFFPPTEQAKKELKRKFNFTDKTLLYAGRLSQEKQVDLIIQALAQVKKTIPETILAITGIGNKENDLKKLAKKLGVEDSVKFLGRVEDEIHAQTYQAAELFVVMSTAETQCISMMKAMSSGIPVIGADARALPNYIGKDEKVGFIVPVGDVQKLAEKIIFLFQHKEKAIEMGKAGSEYAKQFFAKGVAEKWQDIFQNNWHNSMEKLKLSIVIPAYNEEKYLGKCLESVLREIEKSKREIEVIVVNNASSDKTKEVALLFKGVKVIDEQKKGLVWARQAGYLVSKGNIVANIDSDSWLSEQWIEKVFCEFEKNQKLVGLSGPYIYPEMSHAFNRIVKLWYGVGILFHLFNQYILKRGAMMQGGNFVVRKDAMEKIGGFNTEIEFYGEDTDVACRIQKVGKVKFTFDFPMYTSSRRFMGEGLLKTAFNYGINHIWPIIFGRPFSFSHNDFRDEERTTKNK